MSENEYAENPNPYTWLDNHEHRLVFLYTQMKCLYIDLIGPLPDQGYILVIVDTFTRWVELYHTTDATALSAAECLLKHFGRFGEPHQLRLDNGPHFIAEVIREFLLLVGVKREGCVALHYSVHFLRFFSFRQDYDRK